MKIDDIEIGKTFRYQGKRYTKVMLGDQSAGLLDNNVTAFVGNEPVDPAKRGFWGLEDGQWFLSNGSLYQKLDISRAYCPYDQTISAFGNPNVTLVNIEHKVVYED